MKTYFSVLRCLVLLLFLDMMFCNIPFSYSQGLVSEKLTVPNNKPEYIYTKDILEDGVMYSIKAYGTVSDWDTKNPEGVDPCYCYIKWRCPSPEPWGQLMINDKTMHELNGSTIPYNESHVYTIKVKGNGKKFKFHCWDAIGSSGDNSGSFNVEISKEGGTTGLSTETLLIPNDKPEYVYTSNILVSGASYTIRASGTVSDWDTKNPEGVDPCYCYIKWRCPSPEPWGQLMINDKTMHELNGSTIPYNESHVYSIRITGTGSKLKFHCWDAIGSSGDNSGSFKVEIIRD